jgi:hypothetical protein
MTISKVERKFNWKRHGAALFITLLVFTIGILIGSSLTEKRIEFTKEDIEKQQIEYESLQMQLLYLTGQEEKNCNVLLNSLERNIYDLENSRIKLENYIQGSDEFDFELVKRDYMLTEIRYWLLATEAKKVCSSDSVRVLYFYETEESCRDCGAQGNVLTYLKSIFKDKLLVFSLDVNFDEPMIHILKENYGITELPALIVEDQVFLGMQKKEDLIKVLCPYYDSASFEACE